MSKVSIEECAATQMSDDERRRSHGDRAIPLNKPKGQRRGPKPRPTRGSKRRNCRPQEGFNTTISAGNDEPVGGVEGR